MACSNLDRQEEFVAKVAEINRNTKEGEILKALPCREQVCLTNEDYVEFVTWLLTTTTLPRKAEINAKLLELRKLRLTRWHVYQAPESVILPEKSM